MYTMSRTQKRRSDMALTKGEIVQVAGKLVTRVGEALDDPATPDKVSLSEAMEIFNGSLQELLKEYAD